MDLPVRKTDSSVYEYSNLAPNNSALNNSALNNSAPNNSAPNNLAPNNSALINLGPKRLEHAGHAPIGLRFPIPKRIQSAMCPATRPAHRLTPIGTAGEL